MGWQECRREEGVGKWGAEENGEEAAKGRMRNITDLRPSKHPHVNYIMSIRRASYYVWPILNLDFSCIC